MKIGRCRGWIGAAFAASTFCFAPASTQAAALTVGNRASFAAPDKWVAERRGPSTILAAPEGDAHIAILEIGEAGNARAAAAQAWTFYSPSANWEALLEAPQASRDGWDEIVLLPGKTDTGTRLFRQALAFRRGKAWTILLVDGPTGTIEKRLSQVNLVMQSLRAPGYERESFKGKSPLPLDGARLESLKAFVRDGMRELGVPGASMAVMQNGKLVFEGGFGTRQLGKAERVDAHTLFMIGSNTKGLSTLLLAKAIDLGLSRWDQPVVEVYPSFRLGDADATSKVLVRHLVCACTGLPRRDVDSILGTRPGTPASATFAGLASSKPTSGFGEVFQYNNLMGAAAGFIAGHLFYPQLEIGAAYDKAMQEFVFTPLGMLETSFDYGRALAGNHAGPHSLDVDGRPAVAPADPDFNVSIIPYRPTGGAWSSSHDMIRYVQNEIALGRNLAGQRIFSAENMLERRRPNVMIGEDHHYGMGLMMDTRTGVTAIHHGGSTAGYKSDFIVIPEAGVSAVLLTNSDSGQFLLAPFRRRVLELLYQGRQEAWPEVESIARRLKTEAAAARPLLSIPPDRVAAGQLAARYVNPELGALTVERRDGDVIFKFESFGSRMASRRNKDGSHSWLVLDAGSEGFELLAGERQGRRALIIQLGQHEYAYLEDR